MAEFVRAQIFGTTFEITSRYDKIVARVQIHGLFTNQTPDIPICSLWAWEPLGWFGMRRNKSKEKS
jgi:hypothetical protein